MGMLEDTLTNKVRAVLPTSRCPSCGHGEFMVVREEYVGRFSDSLRLIDTTGGSIKSGESAYVVRCCSCQLRVHICRGDERA